MCQGCKDWRFENTYFFIRSPKAPPAPLPLFFPLFGWFNSIPRHLRKGRKERRCKFLLQLYGGNLHLYVMVSLGTDVRAVAMAAQCY